MIENRVPHAGRDVILSASLKIKRSPHLVMYFERGRFVFENFVTRQRFESDPSLCALLSRFDTWKTTTQVFMTLIEYTRESVKETIQKLLDFGLLIHEGSNQDKIERKFNVEWLWPLASRYYHFSTKLDEPYATSDEVRRYYENILRGRKQPPIYKSYPGRPQIKLVDDSSFEAPLFRTFEHRKTVREFSGRPVSFGQVSRIIYYTWGRISRYWSREFGFLLHKTSPSAGARHPVEVYAVVNNVEEVPRGLYHYSVRNHALELLRQGDFRDRCVAYSAGQKWTRKASVLFIMTAIIERTSWKYRVPRAYRAFLLDVGHLSQSFLLASTALGLGAFCIGVIGDSLIEKELNIDGVSETALFAVGLGQPARKNEAPTQVPLRFPLNVHPRTLP